MATLGSLCALAGWTLHRDADIASLGFIEIPLEGRLVFAMNAAYVRAALAQAGIAAIVTTPDLVAAVTSRQLGLASADDPRRGFIDLHNRLAGTSDFYGRTAPTVVDPSAVVDPAAHVDPSGVIIGPGCRIEARAIVRSGSELGAAVRVMPGAVLGAEGFQAMRFGDALLDFRHAGGLRIGDRTVVMANAVLARAVFRQATEIGADCRIGNGAFVSHNCRIGARSLIGHGAVLAGNCRIGADATIGPGAVIVDRLEIGDGATVTAGAVVIRAIAAGERVSGNFAIPHRRLLRRMAERDPKP